MSPSWQKRRQRFRISLWRSAFINILFKNKGRKCCINIQRTWNIFPFNFHYSFSTWFFFFFLVKKYNFLKMSTLESSINFAHCIHETIEKWTDSLLIVLIPVHFSTDSSQSLKCITIPFSILTSFFYCKKLQKFTIIRMLADLGDLWTRKKTKCNHWRTK